MSIPLLPLALLATLAASAAGQSGISTERVDLYQGDPNLVHLDNVTFYDALVDKPHAWAMEFYKDWCGHCQRFASIWSEVARRAKDWGTVIKVGAINCARRRNGAICREFGIHGVPDVKLFGPWVRRGSPGYSGIQPDPDDIIGMLVQFATIIQRQEQPEGWPKLSEYSGSAHQLLRNPEPLQVLILEDPGRSMGRAVQLDLSSYQHLVRVSRTSHLPADLTNRPTSFPAMVLVRGNGSQEMVTAGPGEDPRALFSSVIRRSIGIEDGPTSAPPTATTAAPVPTPAPTRAPADKVFMVDMENAIVVALKQEVTSHAVIEGEALEALRGFLRVLLNLFPGRSHLMGSLHQLLQSITGPERVSGEALERLLKSSSPWWPGLPELQPYQACRGSRPNYRGYSCGLWTLFHTLTVQEFRNAGDGQNATVLPAVHGYVKNFFSCRRCSRHFQQMAAEDGLFNVYSTHDSLLWLWRTHNKVNERVAGDLSDDPLHPKRQFPDEQLCPGCFNGADYDTYDVIEFLLQFYATENFRGEGLDPIPVANLPSVGGFTSSYVPTSQAAGEAMSTTGVQTSSHQQAPGAVPSVGQPNTQQRVAPVRPHTPSHHAAPETVPAPGPGSSLAADQRGSSSVLSVQNHRAPHLVRSRLPPPAVLPPQPGRPEVVPGIMRYPAEMAHVFPTVVRVAPAEEAEVRSGAGLPRTQQRVVYSQPRVVYSQPRVMYRKPRVVYTKPRVVYTKPRVVYTKPRVVFTKPRGTYMQPRVVYSQPRVVLPLYSQPSTRVPVYPAQEGAQHAHGSSGIAQHGAAMPVQSTHRSSHSVRTYWMRANH